MHDYVFVTTYQKHYVPKPLKRTYQNQPPQEFADPIAVGHKQYLRLHKKNITPPEEDGENYYDRFREKHGDVRKIVTGPLNTELIITQEVTKEKVSEYRARFCDVEREIELHLKGKKEPFRLPDDSKIPITTQTADYKNPLVLTPRAYEPPVMVIPPTTLGAEEKRNELLHVKTGISEYTDQICSIGEFILESSLKTQ